MQHEVEWLRGKLDDASPYWEGDKTGRPPREELDSLRRAVAEVMGCDPETWPAHGNAPLAIASKVAADKIKNEHLRETLKEAARREDVMVRYLMGALSKVGRMVEDGHRPHEIRAFVNEMLTEAKNRTPLTDPETGLS